MLRLAMALERMGRHRDVDRLLLFALNGWRGLFDTPKLIPEQQREQDYMDQVQTRPNIWSKGDPASLFLGIGGRLQPEVSSEFEFGRWKPRDEPLSDFAGTTQGFISPDGRIFSTAGMWHDHWVYYQLQEEGVESLGDPTREDQSTDHPFKAILQRNGWISFWNFKYGVRFNTLRDRETHTHISDSDLTPAQRRIVQEMFWSQEEEQRRSSLLSNPNLEEIVGSTRESAVSDRMLRFAGENLYGWVLPSGEFVEIPFWRHREFVRGQEDVGSDPRIVAAEKDLQETEEYCQMLQEKEGHGEWHDYEMEEGRLEDLIIRVAYDLGYIRVGSAGYTLMFEGERNAMVSKYARLQNLTESLGFSKSDFRPVDLSFESRDHIQRLGEGVY